MASDWKAARICSSAWFDALLVLPVLLPPVVELLEEALVEESLSELDDDEPPP